MSTKQAARKYPGTLGRALARYMGLAADQPSLQREMRQLAERLHANPSLTRGRDVMELFHELVGRLQHTPAMGAADNALKSLPKALPQLEYHPKPVRQNPAWWEKWKDPRDILHGAPEVVKAPGPVLPSHYGASGGMPGSPSAAKLPWRKLLGPGAAAAGAGGATVAGLALTGGKSAPAAAAPVSDAAAAPATGGGSSLGEMGGAAYEHLAKYGPAYAAAGLGGLGLYGLLRRRKKQPLPEEPLAAKLAAEHPFVAGFLGHCAGLPEQAIREKVAQACQYEAVRDAFEAAFSADFVKAAGMFDNLGSFSTMGPGKAMQGVANWWSGTPGGKPPAVPMPKVRSDVDGRSATKSLWDTPTVNPQRAQYATTPEQLAHDRAMTTSRPWRASDALNVPIKALNVPGNVVNGAVTNLVGTLGGVDAWLARGLTGGAENAARAVGWQSGGDFMGQMNERAQDMQMVANDMRQRGGDAFIHPYSSQAIQNRHAANSMNMIAGPEADGVSKAMGVGGAIGGMSQDFASDMAGFNPIGGVTRLLPKGLQTGARYLPILGSYMPEAVDAARSGSRTVNALKNTGRIGYDVSAGVGADFADMAGMTPDQWKSVTPDDAANRDQMAQQATQKMGPQAGKEVQQAYPPGVDGLTGAMGGPQAYHDREQAVNSLGKDVQQLPQQSETVKAINSTFDATLAALNDPKGAPQALARAGSTVAQGLTGAAKAVGIPEKVLPKLLAGGASVAGAGAVHAAFQNFQAQQPQTPVQQLMSQFKAMDPWEHAFLFMGLGLGAIGLVRALTSEESDPLDWLLATLGMGVAGVTAAGAGMFGQTAQQYARGGVNQLAGAVGLKSPYNVPAKPGDAVQQAQGGTNVNGNVAPKPQPAPQSHVDALNAANPGQPTQAAAGGISPERYGQVAQQAPWLQQYGNAGGKPGVFDSEADAEAAVQGIAGNYGMFGSDQARQQMQQLAANLSDQEKAQLAAKIQQHPMGGMFPGELMQMLGKTSQARGLRTLAPSNN